MLRYVEEEEVTTTTTTTTAPTAPATPITTTTVPMTSWKYVDKVVEHAESRLRCTSTTFYRRWQSKVLILSTKCFLLSLVKRKRGF